MKQLIILLLISFNIQSQILKPSTRVVPIITQVTQQVQDRLFTEPSFQQPIVYIDFSPLFPGILGLTRKIDRGVYMVDLSPAFTNEELELVLLHELVHVWQLHTEILGSDQSFFIYRNIKYPFWFPYSLRPWEIEANEIAEEVCNPK
tara:strand:- start:149 stop:589 length:441 start_codon:yes stop_codon:yes gene_type:complete